MAALEMMHLPPVWTLHCWGLQHPEHHPTITLSLALSTRIPVDGSITGVQKG